MCTFTNNLQRTPCNMIVMLNLQTVTTLNKKCAQNLLIYFVAVKIRHQKRYLMQSYNQCMIR